MKKNNLAAYIIIAATFTFISCEWFSHSNKKQFTIVGKWKIDSVYKSGSPNDSIQYLIAAIPNDEIFKFNADSTFNRLSLKDSTTENYYLKDSVLFFKEFDNYVPYAIKIKSDSSFSFTNKDSVLFILKKQ
jgi:hypothetical protein